MVSISVNITGKPNEQASSIKFTLAANNIIPSKDNTKLLLLIIFLILVTNFFLFLSLITVHPVCSPRILKYFLNSLSPQLI